MDYNKNIDQLLEKYWRAETSLEEEKWLLENMPNKDQESVSEYFETLNQASQIQSKNTFEDLMGAINSKEVAQSGRVATLGAAKHRSMYRWISSVAAILLVAVTSFFIMRQDSTLTKAPDKLAMIEAEQAYSEVKEALMLVSNKINETAYDAAGKLSKAEPYTEIFK